MEEFDIGTKDGSTLNFGIFEKNTIQNKTVLQMTWKQFYFYHFELLIVTSR